MPDPVRTLATPSASSEDCLGPLFKAADAPAASPEIEIGVTAWFDRRRNQVALCVAGETSWFEPANAVRLGCLLVQMAQQGGCEPDVEEGAT